ncbi:four helix bundle protein [bacterium]|jgi:four helix bundle protein|nr:four helix bundle protein [bacterium]
MPKGFLTYDLAVALYRHVETIQARASLREQLLRASESVVLNIAEGAGRTGKKDQARFYAIALGSLREVQAVFDLISLQDKQVVGLTDYVAACLYRLIHPKPKP